MAGNARGWRCLAHKHEQHLGPPKLPTVAAALPLRTPRSSQHGSCTSYSTAATPFTSEHTSTACQRWPR